jgi:DNA-binding NarL/FixJ family response regulator
MDVLLIDSDAPRRVGVAQHLAMAGHRVTISSSIAETREILQFIRRKSAAPDVVVIEEALLTADKTDFREEIGDRFAGMIWVPLRPDLSLRWLADWVQKAASWGPDRRRKPPFHRKRVLLVETDSAARAMMWSRLTSQGARVAACSSFAGARAISAGWNARRLTPDLIVSPIDAPGGDGISFFLETQRRFPQVRWMISSKDQPAWATHSGRRAGTDGPS